MNLASNSDLNENNFALKSQTPFAEFMFDQFVASFTDESPREELLFGLSELHKNLILLNILEIVRQSFETDEKVLFKKLFVDGRKHVDLMFN